MLLLALLLACGGPPAAQVGPDAVTLSTSDVARVTSEPIAAGPRVSGTLEAALSAVIRAEAGGDVEAVSVEIGDRVTKGQVMAVIEADALRQSLASASANVASAEANEANARRELERITRLQEAGALSRRDVEVAEAQLKAAQAQLEGARAQRVAASQQAGGATVRAPFDGVVATRDVGEGDIVGMGSPLFTVIDPSTLRLEGAVPADAAGLVRPGASARFTVQGLGARLFEGSVERVAPAVDPATRQIPVIIALPNPDGALLAGLFAEGRVAADVHQALVLPSDALDGDHVLRVNGDKVEQVTVKTGVRDEASEKVEILDGVSAGDVVLVGAAREVPAGSLVKLPADGEG